MSNKECRMSNDEGMRLNLSVQKSESVRPEPHALEIRAHFEIRTSTFGGARS